MHRRVGLVACVISGVCAAATARADVSDPPPDTDPVVGRVPERVELLLAPDVVLVQPTFPLDRHVPYERRTKTTWNGSVAIGVDRQGAAGDATLGLGHATENVIVGVRSELIGGAGGQDTPHGLLRGRHRALLELRSDWDDRLVGSILVSGGVDHGLARGLAAPHLGVGRYTDANAAVESMVQLAADKGDFDWVAIMRGEAGQTRWFDAPSLDRATREALTIGTGATSFDGEIPRGSMDWLRGRVEHAQIRRPFAPAIAPAATGGNVGTGAASLDAAVRSVELGIGTHDLTMHIDHELLAIIGIDLGWTWLEADTGTGRLADSAFRMKLATGLDWLAGGRKGVRHLRFGLGRTPTYTPDGQKLVSEWRIEAEQGLDTRHWALAARGGITWLTPLTPEVPGVNTLLGYAAQLDAAYRICGGFEIGAYHASTYQPRLAGDPWASPRHWTSETGVLARLRH